MAFCERCGQQTEGDPEFCTACGGYAPEAAWLDAYSGAPARVSYSEAARYSQAERYFDAEPDQHYPADQDERLRYDEMAPDPYALPQFERRYPGDYLGERERPRRAPRPASPIDPTGHGRWIAIAAAVVVFLIAAAVAVLLLRQHPTAGHAPRPTKPAVTGRSVSPAPSTPQPTVQGLVTVDPGAAVAPHEAAVVAFLNSYFRAINSHDYAAYEQLFSPALRGELSAASFSTGYGSTRDSAEKLHSIGAIGAGQVDALVTFTSHQLAADSPTSSSCTAWSVALYLVSQGSRYLMVAPPQGYQASYHSCS
jgi:hypothetical protein